MNRRDDSGLDAGSGRPQRSKSIDLREDPQGSSEDKQIRFASPEGRIRADSRLVLSHAPTIIPDTKPMYILAQKREFSRKSKKIGYFRRGMLRAGSQTFSLLS